MNDKMYMEVLFIKTKTGISVKPGNFVSSENILKKILKKKVKQWKFYYF